MNAPMNVPECPGCWKPMRIVSWFAEGVSGRGFARDIPSGYEAQYKCDKCGWASPTQFGNTREEAERNATTAANRRPLLKPLSLEQALEICNGGDIVWIEDRQTSSGEYAFFIEEESAISRKANGRYAIFLGTEEPVLFSTDNCGKTWRPWSYRPTAEERAASRWDD